MNKEILEYYENKQRKENLEHRDVLLAIGAIIKTDEGAKFFRYLFKSLNVAELPDQDIEGNLLYESLGFLRAGNSIYKIICEADFQMAALILSKLERERYDDINEQHRIESKSEYNTID